MTDLLPCPFCGPEGNPDLNECDVGLESGRNVWFCKCLTCAIELDMSDTREAAVARWNTRHHAQDELECPTPDACADERRCAGKCFVRRLAQRQRKTDEWELAQFLCEDLALEDFDEVSRTKYLGDAKAIREFLDCPRAQRPLLTPEQIEPILDKFLGQTGPHYKEIRRRCARQIFSCLYG